MKVEQIAEICNPNPPPSNHVRVTKCEFDRTLKDEPIFTGGKAENFWTAKHLEYQSHCLEID